MKDYTHGQKIVGTGVFLSVLFSSTTSLIFEIAMKLGSQNIGNRLDACLERLGTYSSFSLVVSLNRHCHYKIIVLANNYNSDGNRSLHSSVTSQPKTIGHFTA